MTGDRVIVGFDGSKSSTTLAFVIKDINTDALRQIYGAEHFDTKGDYTMELDRKALDARMAQAADGRRVFVLDHDALSALPRDTKIKINGSSKFDVERHMVREVNGAWQWDDGENKPYGNVTKSAFPHWFFPVEVLNPELMGEFKAPRPQFAAGDILVYDVDNKQWHGRRVRVVVAASDRVDDPSLLIESLDHSWPQTYLPARYFRPFDPKRDFRVGDTVRFKGDLRHLGTGVIVRLFGPGESKRDARVKVGSLHYRVDFVHMDLVAAKPEPIREEFDLTGAYVADKAGLDALPVGTVIHDDTEYANGYAPYLLLEDGWHYVWPSGVGGDVAIPSFWSGRGYIVKHVPGEFPAAA